MSRNSYTRRSVKDIRAQFENKERASSSLQPPILRKPLQSRSFADMSSSKDTHNVSESSENSPGTPHVKAASTVSISARPTTSARPSWIGPEPSNRKPLSGSAMKYSVTIEYTSPGLKPPVYICTNLSEPAWEPLEMSFDALMGDENVFYRDFAAPEGDYQYKLRLGPGDWWVCDESKPTVDDGSGNKNNVMTVTAEEFPRAEDYVDEDPNSRTYGRRMSAIHGTPLFDHEAGISPTTRASDERLDNRGWNVKDFGAEGEHSARWALMGSSPRASISTFRRDSHRNLTIVDSDLDDPKLQPCLENKDRILDLAEAMSLGKFPVLVPPHPAVFTKLINRAHDVLELRDDRPGARRMSTTEEALEGLGIIKIRKSDDDHDGKLAMIAEDEEDLAPEQARTSDRQESAVDDDTGPISASIIFEKASAKVEKAHDEGHAPLSTDSENDADGRTDSEKREKVIESGENNISAVFLGLGFVVAVASTAVGIWFMRSNH